MNWLIVVFFVFYFIAWYLSQAFPFEQGRQMPLWFPLLPEFWYQSGAPSLPFADEERNTVRASGLKKAFGGFRAVDGVDFKFKKGQVYALLGHNGASRARACWVCGVVAWCAHGSARARAI
jgi:hypothetical protein